MSIPTKHNNIALIPATILLVITGAAYGGMHWYITHIKVTAEEKLASIVQDDEKALSGHRLASVLKDVEPYAAELSTYGVNSDDIVGFINSIEGLGAKTGSAVTIASINVPDEVPAANVILRPVTMSITITGSWESAMKAIELFENLPYKASFDKFRLVKAGGDAVSSESVKGKSSAGSMWQAQFEMEVLRLK